jgi:tetratricopeptide (TPR) repeat protein
MGRAYEALGRYDEAVAEYTAAGKLASLPPEILARGNEVYAKAGFKAYLQATLDGILKQPGGRSFPPFVIATYYARLGQKEEALTWLERGYEQRDFRITLMSVAWELDGLRSEPRFVALVQKIGLPQ